MEVVIKCQGNSEIFRQDAWKSNGKRRLTGHKYSCFTAEEIIGRSQCGMNIVCTIL